MTAANSPEPQPLAQAFDRARELGRNAGEWMSMGMVLCAECGNKRCPHAHDPLRFCRGSNEPGQVPEWRHIVVDALGLTWRIVADSGEHERGPFWLLDDAGFPPARASADELRPRLVLIIDREARVSMTVERPAGLNLPSYVDPWALLADLLRSYDAAIALHAAVVMDTDQDRALHARAVDEMRNAVATVRACVDAHTAPG